MIRPAYRDAIFCAITLSSCAIFEGTPDFGLEWYRIGEPLPYTWQKMHKEYVDIICGGRPACVSRRGTYAVVYSIWSEEQAKRVRLHDGQNLWKHEMMHVDGWDHKIDATPALYNRR